eukprot:g848.t1
METAPSNIDINDVAYNIEAIPGVLHVENQNEGLPSLRIWRINADECAVMVTVVAEKSEIELQAGRHNEIVRRVRECVQRYVFAKSKYITVQVVYNV